MTVRLVANPQNNVDFLRLTDELVATVKAPEELERLLRDRYPRARVAPGVTDIIERWYVYRDGHWVNTRDGNDWGAAVRRSTLGEDCHRPVTPSIQDSSAQSCTAN